MANAADCITQVRNFSPKDVARLEERVAALNEEFEFDNPNDAYIEASVRIAQEAKALKETILDVINKEDEARAADVARAAEAAKKTPKKKFDNVPDLADAIAAENSLPQAVAQAYTEAVVLGRSQFKIASTLGVPKSTVGDWVRKMTKLVDEAKPERLEATKEEKVETAPEAVVEQVEEAAVEEAAPDQKAETTEEAPEVDQQDQLAEETTASGDIVDDSNPVQGQERRNEGPGINISDAPHGEGETKAKNDEVAEKTYRKGLRKAGGEGVAKSRWEGMSSKLPAKERVEWDALGPGQKAGFADEAKKGKAQEAFESISAMVKEGIRLQTLPQLSQTAKDPESKYDIEALSDDTKRKVLRAMDALMSSPAASMVRLAWGAIQSVGQFNPSDRNRGAAAAYNGVIKSLILNTEYLAKASPTDLVATIAHESVHAVDFEAGMTTDISALSDRSPTSVVVDIDFAENRVDVTLGPVIEEALREYRAGVGDMANGYNHFDQALWSLDTALNDLKRMGNTLTKINLRALEHIADNAAAELTPKLMELYLTAPEVLRSMPLSGAHVRSLAAAKNIDEVRNVLGGGNGATKPAGTNQPVSRQVQVRAQSLPGAEARRVPGPVAAQSGGGKGPPRAPATREGLAGGLTPPPPPITGSGWKHWIQSVTSDKLWRTTPSSLGWLSTEQLADRFKQLPVVKSFSDTMRAMEGRSNGLIAESDKHSTQWSALRRRHGEKMDKVFSQLLLDSTTATIWPDRDLTADGNKHLDAKDADTVRQHAALRKAYNALPQAYKTLFANIVADKAQQRQATIDALRSGIVASYDNAMPAELATQAAAVRKTARDDFRKANAKSADDAAALDRLWRDLDSHDEAFPKVPGPYFPKMRFGDHVVHYKTPTYQAAERAVQQANETLQKLLAAETYAPIAELEAEVKSLNGRLKRSTVQETRASLRQEIKDAEAERDALMEPIKAQRKILHDAEGRLTELRAQGEHYGVEFYESRALALANEERLKAHFGNKGVAVQRDIKDKYLRSMDGVTPSFMRSLEEKMASSLNGVDAARVRDAMRELYIRLQPENSNLKRQLKRMNVSGVRAEEAQRAYALSSMRAAHAISRLEHGDVLKQHLNELRFSDDEDSKLIGNELAQRFAQNYAEPKESAALSFLSNATYLTYLGLSPSFVVTQATQPWVITAPIMAGRHGIRQTSRQLARASVDAAKLLKSSYDQDKRLRYHLDPKLGVKEGIVTDDEARMLQEMLDHGRIDITITHDLGAMAREGERNSLTVAAQFASYPAQQMEMVNRVATALAGYRAERRAGRQHLEAMQYADTLTADTHLNYAVANRARHMHPDNFGGWGRLMFQFRAYQQGMLYLVYKNAADGLRGDKEAQRSLAYLAGMQLATAGLAGMPVPGVMLAALGLLYKAWSDDDEERDLKEVLFQAIKSVLGEEGAIAVTKGIPAALGVDLSAKVGLGNIASVAPYADDRKEGRELVKEYFAATLGGPALGMAVNWAEAAKAASEGDWIKATSYAVPKALADPARAYGYATQGLVDTRGNTILSADELSGADTVLKSLGFSPTGVGRVYDQRRAFFEARENRNDARERLIAKYAQARIKGEDVDDIRQKVSEFNSRNPEVRINYSTLEKAVAHQRKRTREMRDGVPVGKRERQLATEVGVEAE
jgi:hypothetical protein